MRLIAYCCYSTTAAVPGAAFSTLTLSLATSKGLTRRGITRKLSPSSHTLSSVHLSSNPNNGPSLGRSTIANKRYYVFVAVVAITAAVIIWRIFSLALLVSSGSIACSQGSQCTSKMSLSSLSRARAAVLGSFVADAATVGVHWIYDQSKVNIYKSISLKIRTRPFNSLLLLALRFWLS
jgi:hypothetical protein